MKRLFSIASLLLVISLTSDAQINLQATTLTELTGKPFFNNVISEIKGTFFYNEEYKNAKMYLASGLELAGIKVKLNLHDNKVYYMEKDEVEMEAVSKIKRIIFTDDGIVFENGFPAVNKQDAQTYYRVIAGDRM